MNNLISKMDFTAIKYSGQGSFKMKKGTIDTFIFTESHRDLPIASVNDPLPGRLCGLYYLYISSGCPCGPYQVVSKGSGLRTTVFLVVPTMALLQIFFSSDYLCLIIVC